MLKSNGVETFVRNGTYELGIKPAGWTSREVVYSKYSVALAPDGTLLFYSDPSSTVVQLATGVSIDDMARAVLAGTPSKGGKRKRHPDIDSTRETPLDVLVERKCYVVIELDRRIRWQFRTHGPAITTKDDLNQYNGGLHFVEANGTITSGNSPTQNGSRIAFFSVINRRDYYENQYFNLHVELLQPNETSIEVMIDPDIPNNGGSIPF